MTICQHEFVKSSMPVAWLQCMLQALNVTFPIPCSFVPNWVLCFVTPHIFCRACALCPALNMSSNWIRQAAAASTVTRVIRVHFWDRALQRVVLISMPWCVITLGQMKTRRMKCCLLKALVYQLCWSVIEDNGFSRYLATITRLKWISTNSINEVFQMSASVEYFWLQCGFPENADEDNNAAQYCMLSKPTKIPQFSPAFLSLQMAFIKGILVWKLLTVQCVQGIPAFSFSKSMFSLDVACWGAQTSLWHGSNTS